MNFDFTKMLKMAGDLQRVMAEQGKELEGKTYSGEAGGGVPSRTPRPAAGRPERIVIGWMKLS